MFINGPATFGSGVRELLTTNTIALIEAPVTALLHTGGQLSLRLLDGHSLPLPALCARLPAQQASTLPQQHDCELTSQNSTQLIEKQFITASGAWVGGDCCSPMPQLALAIAAGNLVGVILSRELIFAS